MNTGVSKKENLIVQKKRYSAEFKREEAKLVIMGGLSAPEVSERLDVNTGLLYK
tara:strand:- start:778 stop:939 length:162 start_codon:yes stop_codon:yes gene_type:complete